jgi:YD repeat-containing protein
VAATIIEVFAHTKRGHDHRSLELPDQTLVRLYFTGHVTLHTDPNSIRTLLAYSDNLDRLTDVRIFDSAGSLSSNTAAKSHTTFSYPNATTVATKRDRDTIDDQVISSQTVYDSFGRPAESQGPDGSTTYTKYDGMGRTAKVSNPGSSTDWTKQYYDQLGRVLSVTTPDSATSTVDYQANSSTGTMLQVTTTDPSQKSRIVAYDALGRIKQASDNPTDNTYTVTYKYDTLDNLTGVTQNGMTNDRTFTYDSVGRLRTAFNPESGTTYYENGSVPGYDKNGNLTYRKDADSRVTKFEYDDINRVLSKSYYQSDGTTLDANTKKVTYSYDTSGCIGCLSGYSTTLSGMTYSYDSLAGC